MDGISFHVTRNCKEKIYKNDKHCALRFTFKFHQCIFMKLYDVVMADMWYIPLQEYKIRNEPIKCNFNVHNWHLFVPFRDISICLMFSAFDENVWLFLWGKCPG